MHKIFGFITFEFILISTLFRQGFHSLYYSWSSLVASLCIIDADLCVIRCIWSRVSNWLFLLLIFQVCELSEIISVRGCWYLLGWCWGSLKIGTSFAALRLSNWTRHSCRRNKETAINWAGNVLNRCANPPETPKSIADHLEYLACWDFCVKTDDQFGFDKPNFKQMLPGTTLCLIKV